jgi:hypothetical protein
MFAPRLFRISVCAVLLTGILDVGIAADNGGVNKSASVSTPLPEKDLSFVKHIAPILVAKCSRCHIDQVKGKFNMATFEAFAKGTPDGPVFQPGQGGASRIVDELTSGDMPRAGPKATKPEIAAITKWIDEGAKFDGPNKKAPLVQLVSAATAPKNLATQQKAEEPKLTVSPATGRETVLFSRDIAPVLIDNCFVCHSGPQPAANLQMGRFVDFIRGGQSGNPWAPNQPAESLLIKKLKGTAGKRMPQPNNRGPLPDSVIAKFETWISEGARFDGANPNQSTLMLAALTRSKLESHSELAADRLASAKHMWALTDPEDQPKIKQTKNLLVLSSLPDGELQDVVGVAEKQATLLARFFHLSADQPLVKGGIVLFVFPGRYDYSEFGQMVEERTLPREWRGHWKYDTVDAYAAVIPPVDSSDYSLAGLIGQELAAVYLSSLPGNPPAWFAEASGRVLAARVDAKSARVRQWNDNLQKLIANGKLSGFADHKLAPDDDEAAAYGFVKQLMSEAGKYLQLINALRSGEAFDSALARTYGGSMQTLATAWAKAAR